MANAVESGFREKTPRSAELFERASRLFPSGVTHDSRYLTPYPIFVERALGARKWDVDGNEYVDYFGGHGALLLGHSHPEVAEAVAEQVCNGTHFGASHELEVAWAEQVVDMVPAAEKVRFTASGTEASMLGFRLARACTGRNKILRLAEHFHGWHDQVVGDGVGLPSGVPAGIADTQVVCPANDIDAVSEALAADRDIAAVGLEPTGATFGKIPATRDFLVQLRAVTEQHGVLLIFDEVIAGFRVSRGGAQAYYGITPDMTLLAKILAGGQPGGAVVGRADILDGMSMRPDDPAWNASERVSHAGTYNANPVSAVAGLTTLKIVATTDANARANRTGAAIRDGMDEVVRELGLNWIVYGEFSGFHILPNSDPDVTADDLYSGKGAPAAIKRSTVPAGMTHLLRTGMIANGVDLLGWPGGMVSAVHTEEDVDRTIAAFRATATELAPVAAAS